MSKHSDATISHVELERFVKMGGFGEVEPPPSDGTALSFRHVLAYRTAKHYEAAKTICPNAGHQVRPFNKMENWGYCERCFSVFEKPRSDA